jgi:hypothetical protein
MTGIIADNLALAQIPFLERTVDSPAGFPPHLVFFFRTAKKTKQHADHRRHDAGSKIMKKCMGVVLWYPLVWQ